jgi:hypothetical protein
MKERGESQTTYLPPEAKNLSIEQEEIKGKIGKFLDSNSERSKWKHFTPQFVGTKVQEYKVEELAAQINNAQKIFVEGRIGQSEGEVRLKTAEPIGITHLGDLHLGSIYTNTNEVLRKIKRIKEEPNMYVFFMANLIDNAIPDKYPSNMLANALTPDKQVMMMRAILEDLNDSGKIIGAITSPCHEGWTYAAAGQDINALMYGFKKRKFPILENGGRLHVKLGSQEYMGAFYHQVGPFESNFNETHALRQMNRLKQRMEPDWIAGAHRHFAAAETAYEGNGETRRIVGYVRTGSEKGTGKVHDIWATDRMGSTGEPTGQTIHLWPKDRRLLATLDFDDAMIAHESFYLTEMARHK